jgi:hypothetical protein
VISLLDAVERLVGLLAPRVSDRRQHAHVMGLVRVPRLVGRSTYASRHSRRCEAGRTGTAAPYASCRAPDQDLRRPDTIRAALILLTSGLATSFGVALGALIRHQVITVAGTLIWALAVESIIAGLKPAVGQWLPFTAFLQVVVNAEEAEAAAPALSRLEAFGVSVVYIVVASVAAVYTTMRRDVT